MISKRENMSVLRSNESCGTQESLFAVVHKITSDLGVSRDSELLRSVASAVYGACTLPRDKALANEAREFRACVQRTKKNAG
jgi:hypothetical protein